MIKIMFKSRAFGLVGLLLTALLAMGTLLPNQVLAGKSSRDNKPVVDGETQLYPGYPRQFDGHGRIDRVGEKAIVISDNLLPLPSGVDLHTPRSSRAGIGRFEAGDYVGYQLDNKGGIESLWLLQKGKR